MDGRAVGNVGDRVLERRHFLVDHVLAFSGRHPHSPCVPDYPHYPTIVHALKGAAELVPERPGIACVGRELSYAQYAQMVSAMAHRLAPLGVANQRIAVMMSNELEMVAALLGGMAAGAQVCPVNP